MYRKVYMQKKDYRNFQATMRNYIVDQSGELIFAEFVGQKEDVVGILRQLKLKYGTSAIIGRGESISCTEYSYSTKHEPLKKGHYGLIYSENSMKGKNSTVLIGNSDEEIQKMFNKWMEESQPLPYAKGFYEELGEEAQYALFKLLVSHKHIVALHNEKCTVKAYQISTNVLDGKTAMQEAILNVAKRCGLMEIDRLRKLLRENAPKIGESNPDKATIFASLMNQSKNIKYHIIEYDNERDSAFCLVKKDEEILWEEHEIAEIFFDEQIGMLKDEEHKNLVTNIDGNISKAS